MKNNLLICDEPWSLSYRAGIKASGTERLLRLSLITGTVHSISSYLYEVAEAIRGLFWLWLSGRSNEGEQKYMGGEGC